MKIAILLVLAFVVSSLSSCQTMQGLGRDLRGAGTNLERAATR